MDEGLSTMCRGAGRRGQPEPRAAAVLATLGDAGGQGVPWARGSGLAGPLQGNPGAGTPHRRGSPSVLLWALLLFRGLHAQLARNALPAAGTSSAGQLEVAATDMSSVRGHPAPVRAPCGPQQPSSGKAEPEQTPAPCIRPGS